MTVRVLKPPPGDTGACGTTAGYYRHRTRREAACAACRAAVAAAQLDKSRRRGVKPAPAPKPCGTTAAYQRHLYHKETPCDACRRAHRTDLRHRRRRKRGIPLDAPLKPGRNRRVAKCGTRAGYMRHLNQGETACRPCLLAQRTYSREYGRRRRKQRLLAGVPPVVRALLRRREAELERRTAAVWALVTDDRRWTTRRVHPLVEESVRAALVFDPPAEGGVCGTPDGVELGCRCRACRITGKQLERVGA